MRIDATSHLHRPFTGNIEAARPQAHARAEGDSVNLSALATGEMDAAVTSRTTGMISGNADEALSAHSKLDPERALRLLGLLD